MCTFIHWILRASAGLLATPPSWKGAPSRPRGARCAGSLRHRLQVRESPRGLRPDSSQSGREGGGRGQPLWPLDCTSGPYCLSPFATSASSVWSPKSLQISLRHIYHTKDQVTARSGPRGAPGRAAPLRATPRAAKPDRAGGAGNSPVCCAAAGRGRRRGNAGPQAVALRGPRSQALGPGPWCAGDPGYPPGGGGRPRAPRAAAQAGSTPSLFPAQALARSCQWVCFSQQRGLRRQKGGK